MATNVQVKTRTYSGQGPLLYALLDANGVPQGYSSLGDFTGVEIAVEVEEEKRKESYSGARGTKNTITKELSGTISLTGDMWHAKELAMALFGTEAAVTGATVTDESITAHLGKTIPLANIKCSNIVVTDNTGTVTFVEDENYTVNADSGSINILDSAAQTAATNPITEGQELYVDYDFADYTNMEAFTGSAPTIALRFEGVNTSEGNKPEIVNVHKVKLKPPQNLGLVSDSFADNTLEGEMLADETKTGSQSKYFNWKQVI